MSSAPVAVKLGKREQTKARNRAVVMAAARTVFARQGYDAATVRDIVRATDLSVGTFYQYFRDKDEAFLAVVEEVLAGLRRRLRSVRRDRRLSLEERVYRAYLGFFEFVIEERALFDVLERHAWSLGRDPGHSSVELSVQEIQEDLLPEIVAGDLPNAPPDYLAAATVGAGMLVAQRMLTRKEPNPADAARFCTRLVLEGLTRPSSSRRKREEIR